MANQVEDLKVAPRKRLFVFVLGLGLYLSYGFSSSLYEDFISGDGIGPGDIAGTVIRLALLTFCITLSYYAIKRYFEKGPGLVINKLGLFDNSGLVSAGNIFWSDVEEINNGKVLFSDSIIIKVKNPDRFIKNQKNIFKRLWLTLENRFNGTPVNISASGLKIKSKDLFRVIQQHYLSSHVESRTYELKKEKDTIQRQRTELLDSINYAKRIQTALLPSRELIKQHLGDSFILYLPKDIVSGDFYWVQTVDEWVFFAVCDCTGHGVPGALISIVCNNALNRAVKEFNLKKPSLILDKVADIIVESIGLAGDVKDGMDASICAFNKNTRELYWSGANIPMWIAREDAFYELLEFKPDKQPIGLVETRTPYTNHKIEIRKGDLIYLFSDGYADQFGGDQHKKLTRKRFKEQILLQRNITLEQQHDNLLTFHNNYRSDSEQIDDILVLGVRVEQ